MKFNFITLSGSLVICLNKNIKLKSRYMTKWTRIKNKSRRILLLIPSKCQTGLKID